MKIENRIRESAKRKVFVAITRRSRSKRGFLLVRPDGLPISLSKQKNCAIGDSSRKSAASRFNIGI